ncbi:cytochrome P450, partial [Cynara cardunculus var. scolymus]
MEVSMATVMGVGLVLLLLILTLALLHACAFPKEMDGIPGSFGWPFLGESLSFISEFSSPAGIFSFMNKRQQRYGKVFKSYVLGRYMVFTTGMEASKMLLTGKDGMVSLNLFYT